MYNIQTAHCVDIMECLAGYIQSGATVTPVTEDYSRVAYDNGFELLVMNSNGYINGAKLCSQGGKTFRFWLRVTEVKALINKIGKILSLSKDKLLILINGGRVDKYDIRGTYIHPKLVIHLATWVSNGFKVKIAEIVDRWRALSTDNDAEYWTSMGDAVINEPNSNDNPEARVRDRLASQLNGMIEVASCNGIIDIVTADCIIEVKELCDWKHALGQILAYSCDDKYEAHSRRIHLYYDSEDSIDDLLRCNIKKACERINCVATYEKIEQKRE